MKVEQSDRHRGQAYSCRDVTKRLYVVFRLHKEHRQKHADSNLTPYALAEARGGKRKKGIPGGLVARNLVKKSRTWALRCSLSVMKYTCNGKIIRMNQKSSDALWGR